MCNICGNAYQHSSQLTIHSEIHTDNLSHVCKACGRGFKTRRYLTKHRCKYAGSLREKLGEETLDGGEKGNETLHPTQGLITVEIAGDQQGMEQSVEVMLMNIE